ncbi:MULTISPECIES: RcnB family protein [Paraburkholderia]|jgi:Ni/Co efflux regulator RcnB|uniref:Nickel/cobalt transporter regulator n=1 Tax=Paraburkholderia phenazinium TaxID=60549 RepID=A0A1N6KDN8_9BURK|nr:RcnB family protein [Paraburkholderia phenazinium]SIO54709.1 Nickel/cobalt transporter regulator [Paraburkholderia phenazinium]
MKSTFAVPFLIVSLLGTSVAAIAQPHNDDHGQRPVQRGHGRGPAPHEASMGGPGGPVPHNDWHKGERLPAEYRDRNYVVDDWHDHGLQAPPRGYQWVGVNGDYVLAAVATGVIASVLLNAH